MNAALFSLVADLYAEGVEDPLAEPLTLAAVWADLCALAHEPLPPVVARYLGEEPEPASAEATTVARG